MELKPIYHSVVAIDVHQAKLTVCALYEDDQGEAQVQIREFGGLQAGPSSHGAVDCGFSARVGRDGKYR